MRKFSYSYFFSDPGKPLKESYIINLAFIILQIIESAIEVEPLKDPHSTTHRQTDNIFFNICIIKVSYACKLVADFTLDKEINNLFKIFFYVLI
jgi:hypothetical protein